MAKIIGDYYYNDKTGLPMRTSMVTLLLNLILRFVYNVLKMAHSATKRIFPSGIDGKKIIKE